jgi:hypothetical protein
VTDAVHDVSNLTVGACLGPAGLERLDDGHAAAAAGACGLERGLGCVIGGSLVLGVGGGAWGLPGSGYRGTPTVPYGSGYFRADRAA